jgi:hypothetical protein
MRRLPRWLLRQLFQGLVYLSQMWLHCPDPGDTTAHRAGRNRSAVLSGPAAGHPERMCREAPLTRAERMLMAEIDGIGTDGYH